MEAFVNNFQQLICPLFTFFSRFWSVFIKNRHKGQKLYQKSHIPVTLLLPDSTTIQNLDKISESWNIQIFTIFHFLKLIFDGQKIITYRWNGWIIVNKVQYLLESKVSQKYQDKIITFSHFVFVYIQNIVIKNTKWFSKFQRWN